MVKQIRKNAQRSVNHRSFIDSMLGLLGLQRANHPKIHAQSTDAAQQGRRLRNWNATDLHINSILQGDARTIRNRSRQQVRDNCYAANAIESFVANLVGDGVKPSVIMTDDVAAGQPISKELKKRVQWLWYDWIDQADADGLLDFYGQQAVIARALFDAGESFVRFRLRRASDGFVIPLQLQMLEADQLPIEEQGFGVNQNNQVRCGIEFNPIGKRVAYHFYRSHPGDFTDARGFGEITVVPASEIMHIYQVTRPGQIRGIPRMMAAIVKMFILDSYDDAELERKRTAAMPVGSITSPGSEDTLLDESEELNPSSGKEEMIADIEPGTFMKFLPGEEINYFQTPDVGGNYEAFQYRTLTQIMAGMGIPYMNGTGDLRAANYSSMRSGQLEFRRRMSQLLNSTIVYQLCRPVWQRFILEAAINGMLGSVSQEEVIALQRRVKWIPPKWDWIDPQKDVNAAIAEVNAGFASRDEKIEERGGEPDEVDAAQAAGDARAKELGLKRGMAEAPSGFIDQGSKENQQQENDDQQ